MNRLTNAALTLVAMLIAAPLAQAQLSKVAVVDFERAVVESAEGKKSSDRFNATLQAKQAEIEKKQKELEDQNKKLQNGARTLSDTAKADLQKDIERRTTELQRLNEDGQKELQAMRDELLRPIAERASALLNRLANEGGYTMIVDVSSPENNVLWFNPKNDITAELVKRIDESAPAASQVAPAPANRPPAAATPRPTTPAGPGAAAPRPTTPNPTAPPKQ